MWLASPAGSGLLEGEGPGAALLGGVVTQDMDNMSPAWLSEATQDPVAAI